MKRGKTFHLDANSPLRQPLLWRSCSGQTGAGGLSGGQMSSDRWPGAPSLWRDEIVCFRQWIPTLTFIYPQGPGATLTGRRPANYRRAPRQQRAPQNNGKKAEILQQLVTQQDHV